jgi:hypothetical protein
MSGLTSAATREIEIKQGLERSQFGTRNSELGIARLCMSAHGFDSDWAQLEAGTCGRGNCWERRLAVRDPLNKERRFIPLRLNDAPIKASLAQFLSMTPARPLTTTYSDSVKRK